MKKLSRKIIFTSLFSLIFTALFPGCDKSDDVSTNCAVSPTVQRTSGGVVESCTADASVFVHYGIDTLEWKVKTYEDATVGRLTNELTGENRLPEETGRIDMNGNLAFGPVSSEKMLLVAYNRRPYREFSNDDLIINARMYAYRNLVTENGLSELRVSVVFQPWQTQRSYQNAKWTMKNDNTTWTLGNTWSLTPLVQTEEGREPDTAITAEGESDISVFVHYGLNPGQWTVSNYDESREGIITYIGAEDPNIRYKPGDKRYPDTLARANSTDRIFQFKQLKDSYSPETPLSMVLVAHNSNSYSDLSTAGVILDSKMYAFRELEWADVGVGDEMTLSITFNPWNRSSNYQDGESGWTMMNDNPPTIP